MKQSPAKLARTTQERYRFLGKVGRVESFSSVSIGPEGLDRRIPYLVAVVDFGKERAILQLADLKTGDVKVGMKVIGVMRRLFEPGEKELIAYGVKCVACRVQKEGF